MQAGQHAAEPARQPPGAGPEELHDRGDEDGADHHGVDQDGGGEAKAEELFDERSSPIMKEAKTVIMIAAAAVITRPVRAARG